MQKTRKLISMLLAVLMIFSMCTVGMMSVSALPENAVIDDVEGGDASNIDGEVFGLMGDSDGNEKINVKDATQIQKSAAKIVELDEKSEALSDVDLNGKVNVKDATAIQKWVAKIAVDMPINCLVYIPEVETTVVTEPTTVATQDETKPSVPVIVIPTTVVEDPTEATDATEATEATKATDPTEATDATEATKATETTTVDVTETTITPAEGVTIYFQNNWMWSDVCAYCWNGAGGLTAWPGEAMTFVENDGSYDIYSYTLPDDITGFLISGTKDTDPTQRDQTPDILGDWYTGICYYMEWDAAANEGAGGNAVNTFDYVVPTTAAPDVTTSAPDETIATPDETTAAPDVTTSAPDETVVDDGMIDIYFVKPADWNDACIYAYYGEGTKMDKEWTSAWPGDKMTFVEKDKNGNDIYVAEVPEDINVIKFGDGTKTSPNYRTDIIVDFEDGICFEIGASAGTNKWYVVEYNYVPGEETTTAAPDETTAAPDETTAASDDGTITIYFTNNQKWEVVNVHYWGASSTTWPGVAMEFYKTNSYGNDNYKITLPAGTTGVVFNGKESAESGKGNDYQTVNVEGTDLVDGYGYYPDTQVTEEGNDHAKWIVGFWVEEDITPDETTAAPDETTAAPDETTAAPDETTAAPDETTAAPDETTAAPDETTAAPDETTAAPDETTAAPDETTAAPDETTAAPDETTAAPDETTAAPDETTAAPDETTSVPDETVADDGMIDIYFVKPANWNDACIYAYYGEGTTMDKEWTSAWPGDKMTFVEKDKNGNDIYVAEVPEDINVIKFGDGTKTSPNYRTDIIVDFKDGICFELGASAGTNKWYVVEYNYVPGEETTTAAPDETTAAPDETTAAPDETTAAPDETTAATDPIPTTYTVYFVNSGNWDAVAAYMWNEGETPAWPGTLMTKTGEQANGFDVYSITVDATYDNIIFNNNGNGAKTADLTFEAGKYHDFKSAAWYDKLIDVPAPSKTAANVFLAGEFNDWNTAANEFSFDAEGDTICYIEMDLAASTSYKFKVITYSSSNEIEWRGLKYTGTITDSVTDITCSRSAGDTTMTTKAAGKYIFAFDTVNYTISITYPG